MRDKLLSLASLIGLFLLLIAPRTLSAGEPRADTGSTATQTRVIRIGAVAYSPSAVTIFEGVRRYFERAGLPVDYVLYSHYDALVEALHKKQVDIAWNTPLAHAQYHLRAGNGSQALVMRDVDCNFRSMLIVRADAGIHSLDDLKGKTLILGSRQAAEATVLPMHFLQREGLIPSRLKILSLDGQVDLRGNPCSSEIHVLKALQEGRGQAGIIGERLWNRLSQDQPDQVNRLKALWVSPPFSHCVFTASKDFDKELAGRFTQLMLAMDPKDPLTAEAMRLEGTRKWVAGSQEGFQELLKALQEESGCCSAEPAK
ncbi:MAG TPA: PhnD/SsuA/transferrin family substrate-binding protein [Isosphaeraceae bacterium]|nr:PhnD/SsuA/transferrin family substrate-binding protein [Isosphaeraceae bacterium]